MTTIYRCQVVMMHVSSDAVHNRCFVAIKSSKSSFTFFFFNDPPPTEIYTLSLHDALPICFFSAEYHAIAPDGTTRQLPLPLGADLKGAQGHSLIFTLREDWTPPGANETMALRAERSEEHTSELQSQSNLVCRLLLEKKKTS